METKNGSNDKTILVCERFRSNVDVQRLRIRAERISGNSSRRIRTQSERNGRTESGATGRGTGLSAAARSGVSFESTARAFAHGGEADSAEREYRAAVPDSGQWDSRLSLRVLRAVGCSGGSDPSGAWGVCGGG